MRLSSFWGIASVPLVILFWGVYRVSLNPADLPCERAVYRGRGGRARELSPPAHVLIVPVPLLSVCTQPLLLCTWANRL